MNVYLDSSVVLRPLLAQPRVVSVWGRWDSAYASELLGVECRRAIDRLRLQGAFDDVQVGEAVAALSRIERTIRPVRLTRKLLQAASQTMPTVVKTLDAVHLVSAIAIRDRWADDLVFATHDVQQAAAARAFGFDCLES